MNRIVLIFALLVASPASAGVHYLPYPNATVSYSLTGTECPIGSTLEAPEEVSIPYGGLNLRSPWVATTPPLGCHWQGIPACTLSCQIHYPGGMVCTEVCPHVLDCELTPGGPFSLRMVTDFYLLQAALVVDYDGCSGLYVVTVTPT